MDYLSWMRRSAASGDGFYAMLANHMLGQDSPSGVFAKQTLGPRRSRRPWPAIHAPSAPSRCCRSGRRARPKPNSVCCIRYPIAGDAGLQRALMLVAWQAGMATLASQLASLDPTRGRATRGGDPAAVIVSATWAVCRPGAALCAGSGRIELRQPRRFRVPGRRACYSLCRRQPPS